MSRQPHDNLNTKRGLIRTFILIVAGILFLSWLGFDLRAGVTEFQVENTDSINQVKKFILDVVVPASETVFDEVKDFAQDEQVQSVAKSIFVFIKDTIGTIIDTFRSN